MTINSLFISEESRRDWREEERSHLISAQPMISQWRVNPSFLAPNSLRRSQAELGLLFRLSYTAHPPPAILSVHQLINSATSLDQLCKAIGLSWISRIAPQYDGSLGYLGFSSWGLIIEGEEGETQECLAYTERGELLCLETLPKLTRPQIITANVSLEALTKEGVL
jgi:hypothetical protein